MGLVKLWSEHRDAGCPSELNGLRIAGKDAQDLDAEITAWVSACLGQGVRVDERVERRLAEVSAALAEVEPSLQPEAAHYCARLNRLVGEVLLQTGIRAA
jgi:hypothetical protein